MKIALASAPVRNGDIEFNLRSMLDSLRACAGNAGLILFGESVLQGFDALCWNYDVDRRVAVSLTDEPIRRMREAAKALGIAVSFGFIERDGDALYSSQLFIGGGRRNRQLLPPRQRRLEGIHENGCALPGRNRL
ncbi:MAG: nitrilase-related carbon-nitrogen hydrolase [Eubacteriales bacterium]|nr:nitrilase-related carbon-nitrogen hydrolase [Eubacteriales bacterium]